MKAGRVALFFVSAFGSIILPVVILMLVSFLTYKPPFAMAPFVPPSAGSCAALAEAHMDAAQVNMDLVSAGSFPDALCGVQVDFGNKGRALVLLYAGEKEAGAKAADLLDDVPTAGITKIIELLLYQRGDNQAYGMVFRDGPWVVLSEAPAKDGRTAQLEDLPFLIRQKKSLISALLEDHAAWFFIGLGGYLAVLAMAWPRAASWAARVDPVPGIAPLDATGLRKRLLAVNDLDAPFCLQPGKGENEFTVDWKYVDTRWAGLMAAGGVKALAKIRLRLDPAEKVVRAQDSQISVRWKAHGSGSGMGASLKYSWFRGINFYSYSREKVYGLIFRDRPPDPGSGL